MQVIEKFVCPICHTQYDIKAEAQACLDRSVEKTSLTLGDIVEVKYGYGWFDGDKKWVINPDVDMSKHGFSKDCSMGFYYVITHIEPDKHRLRFHVFTKAMTGTQGHREGYTYLRGHYTPVKIDAPEDVVLDSVDLLGLKSSIRL